MKQRCTIKQPIFVFIFTAGEKQVPSPGSVLLNCEVQEMSPGDESVSSVVTEPVAAGAVCNNNDNNNREKEALSVCSEERGTTTTQRATSKILQENLEQPTKATCIAKPKGAKDREERGFKGERCTLATTKAKSSKGPQEVDENTCLEGIVFTNYPS